MQIAVALVFVWLALASAAQDEPQIRGRVVDRDGAAQAHSRIEFRQPPRTDVIYDVTANSDGYFYLDKPRYGTYQVKVVLRDRVSREFTVRVDSTGLNPSTFIVFW